MLLYCVVIEILIHHATWKETKVFRFKSHHIITVSRPMDLQRYFLTLAANDRSNGRCFPPAGAAWKSIGLNRRVEATFPCLKSTFFKTLIKDTTYNHIIVFGPVTWLCRFNYWIFLARQLRPACGSQLPHLFKQRNHSFKAQCQTKGIMSSQLSGQTT